MKKSLVLLLIVLLSITSLQFGSEDNPADQGGGTTSVDPLQPVFSPKAGTFTVSPQISITTGNTEATIKITRDGSDPKTSATAEVYNGSQFYFHGTIKAYAFTAEKEGDTVTATFNVTGVVNLPKTGQTTSYRTGDDGYHQRGVAWPNPRFVDNGDGTITDKLTGLMWQRVPLSTTKTWNDAIDYCNNLELAGHTDWRLPNKRELYSLYNAGQADNAAWLNSQGFSNIKIGWYWSAGTYAYNTSCAWLVCMRHGGISNGNICFSDYVVAVRSGQAGAVKLRKTGQTTSYRTGDDGDLQKGTAWPNPRFTDNGNGTITDNLTGLMWQRVPLSTTSTWNGAIDYCNNLTLAGYTDWRLPNVLELESLYNASRADNAAWLNSQGFSNVQNNYYWSAGTDADLTDNAWLVYLSYGYFLSANRTNDYYVVAVRSGR